MDLLLPQILLLLGTAVLAVVAFQRLHIPSSLGYLLAGVILGPYTAGPVVEEAPIRTLAELGIVFLLFSIGLGFSPQQIRALRNQVLGLGAGQVVLTTLVVALAAWLAGLPVAVAFVVGAVFAQSSTTIISRQLAEQREESSVHGRLATTISVFQDVTAVPFVVVIPALAAAAGTGALAGTLGWAVAKAALAFLLVFAVGRWVLRPLFHLVAERRSAEAFTLSVLFVSLIAAWTTNSLGLSMAFGAFLVGMMLGETEFRQQVESSIRPFKDVLIGLFFVGVGMLFDPRSILQIWHWALLGALGLLLVKIVLVVPLARLSGVEPLTAWRTALVVAVGGEFGFALLAIALGAGVVSTHIGQIVLTAVLFSMIIATFLIRYNREAAGLFVRRASQDQEWSAHSPGGVGAGPLGDHVIICGYGRIGQSVGHFLEEEKIPFVALDLDAAKVYQARNAGEPVFYGNAAEPDILEAAGIDRAKLLVISHADTHEALRVLHTARYLRPDLPIMVRTPDESRVEALKEAGASEVIPETLEAGLMIASQALVLMNVPLSRVVRRVQEQRISRYPLLRELPVDEVPAAETFHPQGPQLLRPVLLGPGSRAVGRTLGEIALNEIVITALVREGQRQLMPSGDVRLEVGDALMLFGAPDDLQTAERALLG